MSASNRYNHATKSDAVETETSGQIQPLKIPDAVVALAQAAAKANGETEKYLSGWPLFSPPKVPLDKCTKCSREFCSSINFRRHTRVHRRTLKIDKDFRKNRDYIATFWDKLTEDEAKTILSLSDVVIEGVTGSSVLTALTTWMCKPGYASLPVSYARAGSELLDLIQTKASLQLRVSSNELFSVLDEASEGTFFSTNTAPCIQKFLFDGEADKVATELKNVVACTSYMLERKLVEAWSADKAAEALRCQRLLVEEEEAAQRRQAGVMERRRMKKLKQKEQRLKYLRDEDASIRLSGIMDDATDASGIQSLKALSDPGLFEQEDSQDLNFPTDTGDGFNEDSQYPGPGPVDDACCDVGHEMSTGEQVISRCDSETLVQASFVSGPTVASLHPARHSEYMDVYVGTVSNGNKTCEWKVRPEEQCPKHELDIDDGQSIVHSKSSRVLIGSISIAIENGCEHLPDIRHPYYDSAPPSSTVTSHSLMQPISHENRGSEGNPCIDWNIVPAVENHSSSSVMTDESSHSTFCKEDLAVGGHLQHTMFSSKEATAFLSRRWKDTIAADHVKLVLCPEK